MTVRAGLGLAVLAAVGCGATSLGAADYRPPATATPGATPAAGATVTPEAEPATEPAPAPDDAIPWDTIDAFYEAERGRYTEITGISGHGFVQQTMMQETVRFDLSVPYIDRTIKVPEEMLDADTPPGDLRFVYTDDTVLMWNPSALEPCGTHWIDMSDLPYGDILGFDFEFADLMAVKPLEFLDSALDEPRHVKTTGSGSTYEVTVPAHMGMRLSSGMAEDPEALDAFMEIDVVAQVILPADGGSLTLSADFTEAFRLFDQTGELPPDSVVRTAWTVTTDIPPFSTDLPTDVADGSCMDPGSEI